MMQKYFAGIRVVPRVICLVPFGAGLFLCQSMQEKLPVAGSLAYSKAYADIKICEERKKMMKEKLQITLAISLHAPNDEIRQQTMPVARRYSMDELLLACRDYFQETKRRITFEYSMIRGVNDSAEQAVELAGRLRGLNCHINLIPLNEVKGRSRQADIERFKKILEKQGMNVTIRREMGSDIDAACGQLRQNYMNEETK